MVPYPERVRDRSAPRLRTAVLVALACLVAAGCGGSDDPVGGASASASPGGSPEACAEVSDTLVAAVQRYVDAYGDPVGGAQPKEAQAADAPDGGDLQRAMRRAEQSLLSQGCDFSRFREDLDERLDGVQTRGPVARALLLRLHASLTGQAEPAPKTVTVRPGDALPERVGALAPGSVVRLAAGTHRLREPLALLRGVTLRGAGPGRTVVRTTAADAGMMVLTDGRVELRALTLAHRGKAGGDLLVGGPSSSVVLTDVRIEGARASKSGQGGNGVLMTSPAGTTKDRGTTLEVTGSVLHDNAAAGILLTGGHVASIRRTTFTANGECGVCFVDATSGAVRQSTFTDNRVGVAVLDRARPALVGDTFAGGAVGVQVSDRGRPVVRNARVSDAERAALIFGDRARGRVDGSSCTGVPFGIVVSPDALPYLGDNDCAPVRGQ